MGMDTASANALQARSALLALPGTAAVIWLYYRWSSIKALVLFVALTAAVLLIFAALGALRVASPATPSRSPPFPQHECHERGSDERPSPGRTTGAVPSDSRSKEIIPC